MALYLDSASIDDAQTVMAWGWVKAAAGIPINPFF